MYSPDISPLMNGLDILHTEIQLRLYQGALMNDWPRQWLFTLLKFPHTTGISHE